MPEIWDITLATGNAGKRREFDTLCGAGSRVRWHLPATLPPVAENAPTFAGNALLKAQSLLGIATTPWILSEDSGLVVSALSRRYGTPFPGIFSNRWLSAEIQQQVFGHILGDSEQLPEADRNTALFTLMAGEADRSAAYHASMVLVETASGKVVASAEADMPLILLAPGEIPRGVNGFGYDTLACAVEFPNQTVAELSSETKNQLSHRGKALRHLLAQLT